MLWCKTGGSGIENDNRGQSVFSNLTSTLEQSPRTSPERLFVISRPDSWKIRKQPQGDNDLAQIDTLKKKLSMQISSNLLVPVRSMFPSIHLSRL